MFCHGRQFSASLGPDFRKLGASFPQVEPETFRSLHERECREPETARKFVDGSSAQRGNLLTLVDQSSAQRSTETC